MNKKDIDPVILEVINLSDGTLATLCNKRLYSQLDSVRIEWLRFCEARPGQFEHWQKAWAAYQEHVTPKPEAAEVNKEGTQ